MTSLEQYYAWQERRRKAAIIDFYKLNEELKENFYLFIRDNGLFNKNELCGNLNMYIICQTAHQSILRNPVRINMLLRYMCNIFNINTKRYERLSDKWENEANKIIIKYFIKHIKRAQIREYISLRRLLGHCQEDNILNGLYNISSMYNTSFITIGITVADMITFLKYKKEDEEYKQRKLAI